MSSEKEKQSDSYSVLFLSFFLLLYDIIVTQTD